MKSLDAALGLLRHFSDKKQDYSVGELADLAAMPKSQVSKILSTFRTSGMITQNPQTKRYSVGAVAFALGSRYVNHSPLMRAALPIMHKLVDKSGHSVRICIRVADEVLYLFCIEGPHFVDTGWRAGQWLPLHASSATCVILASMKTEEINRLLDHRPMEAFTPHTITDRAELMKVIADVRVTGIARYRDQAALGLATLSVPVFGQDEDLIATLTIAYPSHVMSEDQELPYIEMLHRSARILSQKMGSDIYPFGNIELVRSIG